MHELQVESNGSPQVTTRSSRALNDEIRPFTDAKSPNTLGKPVEEIGLKREFDWRVIYQCCGGCSRMVRQKSSVSVGSKAVPACCLILLQGFLLRRDVRSGLSGSVRHHAPAIGLCRGGIVAMNTLMY